MQSPQYAGFWIRSLASLIDVALILALFGIPLSMIYGDAYWASDKIIYGAWDFILGWVAPITATLWFWLKLAATPGKLLCKIQVLDADTAQMLTPKQACIRYIGYFLAVLPLGLGILVVGTDKKKQGLHDKLAKTMVIYQSK